MAAAWRFHKHLTERYAVSEPRVKAGLWVQIALRLADKDGHPGMVLRKGDPDAGGILIVLRNQHGFSVLSQTRSASGALAWLRGTGPAPVTQQDADAYVSRRVKSDPDLWVLEFDAPDLAPPFEAIVL